MRKMAVVVVLAMVLSLTVVCNGGVTSTFVRKVESTVDMPHESDVFQIAPGYNAPEQRYIKQYNAVELSALGMAIPTLITIAESLKSNGVAVEKSISTSTVVLVFGTAIPTPSYAYYFLLPVETFSYYQGSRLYQKNIPDYFEVLRKFTKH